MNDTFTIENGTNREWTTTEEADLIYYGAETPKVTIDIEENGAQVMHEDLMGCVQLWAIGDNLYVAYYEGSLDIYWSNSLKDAFDFAAEAVSKL